ncbi:hypothetical protein GDO86_017855 [Hymenochirus boettgeri]|uniref:Histone-lysine N-methyltransferase ASH1L n=1 Tax=Hymenochirus boettgeri TaxID=247094 RepID=A0A8T2IKK0_9PIPI|nr:hypothetical protein GDO86_017855 [Hymenochirus boettgeri]
MPEERSEGASSKQESKKAPKKPGDTSGSRSPKLECLHLNKEDDNVSTSRNPSPLHLEPANPPDAVPSRPANGRHHDCKDRAPVNCAPFSVTEKLAQLIATCPPSKSSKNRARKQGSSALNGVVTKHAGSPATDGNVLPVLDPGKPPGTVSDSSEDKEKDPLPCKISSKALEKSNPRHPKEGPTHKLYVRKEAPSVQKEPDSDCSSAPQRSLTLVQKSIPDLQEKIHPVYCTSLDFRLGGVSDTSMAKSPFSAVGEGNLPSPVPATSVTSSSRSPNVNFAHSPHSLHLNPVLEFAECTNETCDEPPFVSENLPVNRGHQISQNKSESGFLHVLKSCEEITHSAHSETTRTHLPSGLPGRDKMLAPRIQPTNHKSEPSVVSFASLLRKQRLLKISGIAERTFGCIQNMTTVHQKKSLKKKKGKRPRWTKVVSKTAGQSSKDSTEQGNFKDDSYTKPLPDKEHLGKFLAKTSLMMDKNKSELSKPSSFNTEHSPSLGNNPKQTHKLYESHRTYTMLCRSRDFSVPLQPKRGKLRGQDMPHLDALPKKALKIPASKVISSPSKEDQGPPVLQPEVEIPSSKLRQTGQLFPKKRGRPSRQLAPPTLRIPPVLSVASAISSSAGSMSETVNDHHKKMGHFNNRHLGTYRDDSQGQSDHCSESVWQAVKKGNGQLVKTIIHKINRMKTIKRRKLVSQILSTSSSEQSDRGSVQSKLQGNVSTLAATFSSKLGQQINVSKKGTIYIGKRRGRKPKGSVECILSKNSTCLSSLNITRQRTAASSEGQTIQALMSPAPSILPSPVGSHLSGTNGALSPVRVDASFVEPSSVSYLHMHSRQSVAVQTLAMKKALRDTRQLSPPTLLPNSPSHMSESMKEATPSPISESHSDETIPSDSGIGTDNNSTSDRAEKFCGQKKRRHSFEHMPLMPPETSTVLGALKEKHKHKYKHRNHDFLGYDKIKRQKRKRKKKHPPLRSHQDPDFLAELEELITRLSEIRITHRSHHFIPRDLLPTIFRLNFNNFYSHQTFPLEPLHYIRKPNLKKKRGRPPKLREAMAEMPFVHSLGFPLSGTGFYPSYGMPYSPSPLTAAPIGLSYYGRYPPTIYPPPPSSFTTPLPPPSYMHTGHLLLNPAKYHKKKHKLLRQEAFLATSRTPLLSVSTYPSVPAEMAYSWMFEHKHRHRHKHRDHRLPDQSPLSVDPLTGGVNSSRTVLESLKRYKFGKDAMGDRYKHKDKHRCHLSCAHLPSSQWARRDSPETSSLSLGLQSPLQIDCSDSSPGRSLGGFTPNSEPASSDEHTNLFTSAIGNCRVTNNSLGRKPMSDTSALFTDTLSRSARKEQQVSSDKAPPSLSASQERTLRQSDGSNCSPSRRRTPTESPSPTVMGAHRRGVQGWERI